MTAGVCVRVFSLLSIYICGAGLVDQIGLLP